MKSSAFWVEIWVPFAKCGHTPHFDRRTVLRTPIHQARGGQNAFARDLKGARFALWKDPDDLTPRPRRPGKPNTWYAQRITAGPPADRPQLAGLDRLLQPRLVVTRSSTRHVSSKPFATAA